MSRHERQIVRRLVAARQAPRPATQLSPAPQPAPSPGISEHPDCPPLEPNQTEAAHYKAHSRPQIPPSPERQQVVTVVATELMKALIGKLGRDALCTEDVHDCVDSAQELVMAAAR